jgi:hypothetical protein
VAQGHVGNLGKNGGSYIAALTAVLNHNGYGHRPRFSLGKTDKPGMRP